MVAKTHTPTPWKIIRGAEVNDFIVVESTGNTVCETNAALFADPSEFDSSIRKISAEEAYANAQFIVTACNSFEQMRDALTALADLAYHAGYCSAQDTQSYCQCGLAPVLVNARAALAAASGETKNG